MEGVDKVGFAFFDIVATFFQSFGSAYLITTVVIFMFVSILASYQAGKEVIILVLMPFLVGVALNVGAYFSIPTYLIVMGFVIMGALFAGIYFMLLR